MGIRCILDSISDKLDAAPRLRESKFEFLACREEGNGLYRDTNSTTSARRDEEKNASGEILADLPRYEHRTKMENASGTKETVILRSN